MKSSKSHQGHSMEMSPEMQQCIQNCLNCHSTCVKTVSHCLEMGGKHSDPAHIRLLLDCAEICQTSANFMLRGSDLHGDVCGVCATICQRCAQDCEKFRDDETMQECARMCYECAESCRQMAQVTGSAVPA